MKVSQAPSIAWQEGGAGRVVAGTLVGFIFGAMVATSHRLPKMCGSSEAR